MAEKKIIQIPSTPLDCPIGRVFNNIFVISNATEILDDDNVVWDFSNVSDIHPFMAFALSLFVYVSEKEIEFINESEYIQEYLSSICFGSFYDVSANSDYLGKFITRSYIPICRFAPADDEVQRELQDLIEAQSKASALSIPFSYILGELICNVAQHSECDDVYFFSQYDEADKVINVCIADTGVGIYGSYVRAGKYLERLGDNDAMALQMANEGYSAKNLPEAENRGFGISTSKKMLVNGLGGSFYVMSGSSLQLTFPESDDSYLELPHSLEWNGTMIFLRIPVVIEKDFNYIDYLE